MPKFFTKRKSNPDDSQNAEGTPPVQPSFRVLERDEVAASRTVEGFARIAKAPLSQPPKDYDEFEDNMFASLKTNNRGSGLSNITHPTYTDNSSRHSNASTAPSSADYSGGNIQDDHRVTSSKSSPEATVRASSSKSSGLGSKLLGRAGRTFSFGGQKKHPIISPNDEPLPDIPPLTLKASAPQERARGLVVSTMPAVKLEADPIDLGTDFRSMLPSFDKRASMASVRKDDLASPRVLTGSRSVQAGQPVPPSPVMNSSADPLLSPWSTDQYGSRPDSPLFDGPPPVPPHQNTIKAGSATRRMAAMQDEESELLEESFGSVARLVASDGFASGSHSGRLKREEESFTVIPRKQSASKVAEGEEDDDNLFEGSSTRLPKPTQRYAAPKSTDPPRNKVMTRDQFERYREDKIRQSTAAKANGLAQADSDSDSDINYDDDEDEAEKSKEQTRQRRKQEAHMAVYRQQMMKVTGETASPASPSGRQGLPSSMSAPQLSHMKGPQPLSSGVSDGDEDEEIPLAILQAHGFPNKNKPPARLNNMSSNPNLRASMHNSTNRPLSIMGDAGANRRYSVLPAFARGLPQDPFFGASIARPAVRESLLFNDTQHYHKSSPSLPPGGLVGVIASEERSRALRRGSPSVDATRMMSGGGFGGNRNSFIDPVAGIPHHMMYNQPAMGGGGMQGMMPQMMQQPMQQPRMAGGDQSQAQMTQQSLSQLMQMQFQFMQMMSNNPGSGVPQQQFMGMPGNNSMMNLLSARNSFAFDPAMDSRRADYNARTMSMVQPSSAPMVNPGYASSVRSSMHGYAPSIAPSERSNIGLPRRYRPVSSAVPGPSGHVRSSTMGDTKTKTAMRVVNKSASSSSSDDEQGWEAMKANREKRKSFWRSQKTMSTVV